MFTICLWPLFQDLLMSSREQTILSNVTLAVLAGGSGNRMGVPKAWLQLGNKSILVSLLERMRWAGPTLLVCTPGTVHPPGCEMFDREVTDPVAGLGPLRGILTALETAATTMVATVTVDMPGVGPEMLAHLIDALEARTECNGLMCRVKRQNEYQIEPFPSVFRVKAASNISVRLDSSCRSVRSLCDEDAFCAIEAPQEWGVNVWTNLNTRNDLAAFESATIRVKAEEQR
jgi:molybdopterin-guanine dinucleotide biosynthesis protein A